MRSSGAPLCRMRVKPPIWQSGPRCRLALRAHAQVPVVVHARLPVHRGALRRDDHVVAPLAAADLRAGRPPCRPARRSGRRSRAPRGPPRGWCPPGAPAALFGWRSAHAACVHCRSQITPPTRCFSQHSGRSPGSAPGRRTTPRRCSPCRHRRPACTRGTARSTPPRCPPCCWAPTPGLAPVAAQCMSLVLMEYCLQGMHACINSTLTLCGAAACMRCLPCCCCGWASAAVGPCWGAASQPHRC